MKKLFLGTMLLVLAIIVPIPATAEVSINVGISLPPHIAFSAPPELIVLPGTYVYVAPDVDEDIYFYNGWWWRPWEGHWYRSRSYNSGWSYYRNEPSFYRGIHSGWRDDYRANRWQGQQWNHQQIPYHQVQKNWSGWQKNRHWEKQQTWGVQGFQSQPQSHQPSQAVQPQHSRPQAPVVNQERSQQRVNTDNGHEQQQNRRTRSQQPQQEVQSQQSQPQSKEVRPNRSPQRVKTDNGPEQQQSQRTRSQQPQQEVQSQQSQPQSKEVKPNRSPQHGKPEGGQEEIKDKDNRDRK
jgi:hypothetical protein